MNYNLDELLKDEHTEISIKKIRIEHNDDAKLRRFKEKYTFMVGLILIASFFMICVYFIFREPTNTIAMSSAFAIASGFAGYILRGKN